MPVPDYQTLMRPLLAYGQESFTIKWLRTLGRGSPPAIKAAKIIPALSTLKNPTGSHGNREQLDNTFQ
jgi:hypothetical protein